MNVIHKEVVRHGSTHTVPGKALHVGFDPRGDLCVWFLRHPSRLAEVLIVGTGQDFEGQWQYLNTVEDGQFMWHALTRTVRTPKEEK